MSHHLGNLWKDTPFSDAANSAWDAFEKLLPKKQEVPLQAFSEYVTVINRSPAVNPQFWMDILEQALAARKIRISYKSPGLKAQVTRTIYPYHLIHHRDGWYLLGYDEYREGIRIFALSRIKSIECLEDTFQMPKDFSLGDFIDPEFGIFNETAMFEVELVGSEAAIEVFCERLPEKQINTQRVSNNLFRLKFSTNQREEIKHLVLQWGTNLEVRKPSWLRRFLLETGQYFCQRYRDDHIVNT
jgi:predicted DNA-binding transcriptional regulator YafY